MCDNHSDVLVEIPTASDRGHLRKQRAIDGCIAPVVDALNKAGVATVASCCGHGGWGNIALADGRELLIAPDFDSARRVESIVTPQRPEYMYGGRPCEVSGRSSSPAGSGTTLAVATGHGRDAIGIDLDERNSGCSNTGAKIQLDLVHWS